MVTIFHNPACSTSRKVLEAIRARGVKPKVVEYLKVGWTRSDLTALLATMRRSARDVLRLRGTPAEDLGLTGPDVGEDKILDAMVRHPVLVERPIVITAKGAALCRPAERLAELF